MLDPETWSLVVGALVIVGVVGTVVPVLPGLLLVAAAIGVWAGFNGAWWLLAVAVVVGVAVTVLKFALPARTAGEQASGWALGIGAILGLVGFFVIPVIGLPVGFVAGVLLSELVRLRDLGPAWQATWATLKSVAITMLVEFIAATILAGLWVFALVTG